MLDELELTQVQELTEDDRRALAEHKPPGMDGSLLQNLGRRPTRIVVRGVASGADARTFVEQLEDKFRAGAPVAFAADIVADAEIERLLIDDLVLEDVAGRPDRFAYALALQEHVAPVAPAEAPGLGLETDILDDALGLVDALTAGLEIVEQLSAFVERLTTLNEALRREGVAALFPTT